MIKFSWQYCTPESNCAIRHLISEGLYGVRMLSSSIAKSCSQYSITMNTLSPSMPFIAVLAESWVYLPVLPVELIANDDILDLDNVPVFECCFACVSSSIVTTVAYHGGG